MRGTHTLRFWAKTQASIAQSSAESELFGAVRGGVEALGAQTLLSDLGVTCDIRLLLDASAALGILQRRGVGKVRHLDVGALWLQEREAQKRIRLEKVHGEKNPADLGTKYLSEEVTVKHLLKMNYGFADGRAQTAARLLNELTEVRVPRLPKLWDLRETASHPWVKESASRWARTYKNARALRGGGDDPHFWLPWSQVLHYKATDAATGDIFEDCDVADCDDAAVFLHRHLPRPVDLRVELTVKTNDEVVTAPSEEESSDVAPGARPSGA